MYSANNWGSVDRPERGKWAGQQFSSSLQHAVRCGIAALLCFSVVGCLELELPPCCWVDSPKPKPGVNDYPPSHQLLL